MTYCQKINLHIDTLYILFIFKKAYLDINSLLVLGIPCFFVHRNQKKLYVSGNFSRVLHRNMTKL